jgi:hypothetical protein
MYDEPAPPPGLPTLHFTGLTWALLAQGQPLVSKTRTINLILVNSHPFTIRLFPIVGGIPQCWSRDGRWPEPGVPARQAATCRKCPHGKWLPASPCVPFRRLIVALETIGLAVLNVPTMPVNRDREGNWVSSAFNLKRYIQFLDRHRYPPNACVTHLSIDTDEFGNQTMRFAFVQPLDDEAYAIVSRADPMGEYFLSDPVESAFGLRYWEENRAEAAQRRARIMEERRARQAKTINSVLLPPSE